MSVCLFDKTDSNFRPPLPPLNLLNVTKQENSPLLVPQDRQRDQTRHIRPPSMTCQLLPTFASGQPETTTQKHTNRSPLRNTPTGHHTELHHMSQDCLNLEIRHMSQDRNTPHVTRQKYTTCHKTEIHHTSQDRNTPHITRQKYTNVTRQKYTTHHKTEIHHTSQDRNIPHITRQKYTTHHKTEIHHTSQDHPSLETHPQATRLPQLRNTPTGHRNTPA